MKKFVCGVLILSACLFAACSSIGAPSDAPSDGSAESFGGATESASFSAGSGFESAGSASSSGEGAFSAADGSETSAGGSGDVSGESVEFGESVESGASEASEAFGESVVSETSVVSGASEASGVSGASGVSEEDGGADVPQPVSGGDASPDVPQPVSGGDASPDVPPQPVSGGDASPDVPPQPVSGGDASSDVPPQPVSGGDASTDIPPAPGSVFVSNGILISGTRGMEQFFGTVDGGTQFSRYVSEFKARLGDGVSVYSVVVPHASCYYAPAGYEHLTAAGKRAFDNLKAQAGDTVGYVDLYSTLASHLDEPIYPRTECHWNALAAYYAAEAFAKSAGTPFPPLDTYTEVVKPGFVGTLYTFSKAAVLRNNPEDYVYYIPNEAKYTAYFCSKGVFDFDKYAFKRDSVLYDYRGYAAFLGGIDTNSIRIETNANTGRKLLIFKDSYGNAFVPFVLSSFDEVYVVDIRYFNRNGVKFCRDLGVTDLAFVVSGFTATGVVYKNIGRILNAP